MESFFFLSLSLALFFFFFFFEIVPDPGGIAENEKEKRNGALNYWNEGVSVEDSSMRESWQIRDSLDLCCNY